MKSFFGSWICLAAWLLYLVKTEVCKTKMTLAVLLDSTVGIDMPDFMEQQNFLLKTLNYFPAQEQTLTMSVRVYYRNCPHDRILIKTEGFWGTSDMPLLENYIHTLGYFQAGHRFNWSCALRMLSRAQERDSSQNRNRFDMLLIQRAHLSHIRRITKQYVIHERGSLNSSRLTLLVFRDNLDAELVQQTAKQVSILAYPLQNSNKLAQEVSEILCRFPKAESTSNTMSVSVTPILHGPASGLLLQTCSSPSCASLSGAKVTTSHAISSVAKDKEASVTSKDAMSSVLKYTQAGVERSYQSVVLKTKSAKHLQYATNSVVETLAVIRSAEVAKQGYTSTGYLITMQESAKFLTYKTVALPLSAAGYPLSTAGYSSTTAGYPSSTAGNPSSTAGNPSSTAGYPSSTAGYHLPKAGYSTSIIHVIGGLSTTSFIFVQPEKSNEMFGITTTINSFTLSPTKYSVIMSNFFAAKSSLTSSIRPVLSNIASSVSRSQKHALSTTPLAQLPALSSSVEIYSKLSSSVSTYLLQQSSYAYQESLTTESRILSSFSSFMPNSSVPVSLLARSTIWTSQSSPYYFQSTPLTKGKLMSTRSVGASPITSSSLDEISPSPSTSPMAASSSAIPAVLEIEKDVSEFLETNVTNRDLRNDTWTQNFVDSADKLLAKIDNKENVTRRNETPPGIKVVLFVEEVAIKMAKALLVGQSKTIASDSIVLKVAAVNTSTFSGFSFSSGKGVNTEKEQFTLPPTLFSNVTSKGKANVAVFSYASLKSMQYSSNYDVSVKTISAKVEGMQIRNLVDPLVYSMTVNKGDRPASCSFWDFNSVDTLYGGWSLTGCSMIFSNSSYVTCACDHLTNFAVLMQVTHVKASPKTKFTLMLMSYVGCGISILGCLLLLAVYTTLSKLLREDRNMIHIHLALAIGIANILFLTAEPARKNEIACTSIALAMFYFFLAAFFWMLVEGIHVYLMVVKVFRGPKKLRAYILIGWVIPALITVPVGIRMHKSFRTEDFCWITTDGGAKWVFAGPVVFVLFINSIILVITLRASYKMGLSEDEYGHLRTMAKLTLLLMPIFGLTWVFGLLTINEHLIAFQYLFTILNSLQGFFIFLFYCVFNSEVRREYQGIRKQSTYAGTSSTSASEKKRTKSWGTSSMSTGNVKLVGWTPITSSVKSDANDDISRSSIHMSPSPQSNGIKPELMYLAPLRKVSSNASGGEEKDSPLPFSSVNGGSRTELLQLGCHREDCHNERSYKSYKPDTGSL